MRSDSTHGAKGKFSAACCALPGYVVVFFALAVSLPMAFISLAKVILCLTVVVVLFRDRAFGTVDLECFRLRSTWVILLAIGMAAFSLSWTSATPDDALLAFVKHAKLITIPMIFLLARSTRHAVLGLTALLVGQTFALLSSWLMALEIPMFWVPRLADSFDPTRQFVPYSDGYLDQSIMFACSAAVAWFIGRVERRVRPWLMIFVALALLNVLILMPARTGYLLAISVLCLALVWELRTKFTFAVLLFAPIAFGSLLFLTIPRFETRVNLTIEELARSQNQADSSTSIGTRLHMWDRSFQALKKEPLTGYGVGSWTQVVKKMEGTAGDQVFGVSNGSNPHQEFLLWAVEFGVVGTVFLTLLLLAVCWDIRNASPAIFRSTVAVVMLLALTSLFNSALYDDLLGDYFCVTLGLLLSYGVRSQQASELKKPPHREPFEEKIN